MPTPSKYTEPQLIPALRKAHAAGDVPAARAIAREIRSIREAEGRPGPWTKYQAQSHGGDSRPIEVDMPDGAVAEFPAGTPHEVMERALRQHHSEQQQPQYFREANGTMHQFPADATPEEIDEATRDLGQPSGSRPASQKLSLILEAERRGILPSEMAGVLAEARQRGLVDRGGAIDPSQVQWDAPSRPDFSGVSARADSTERAAGQPRKGNAVGRALGEVGGRQVLQGAYGLYGALGGDAINHYVLDPIDKAAGWGTQLGTGGKSYRDTAAEFADSQGMRKPETASERVMSDVGEGLTGTALTMGLGGMLNQGRQFVSSLAPTVRSRLAQLLTAQPALQTVSTAAGTGAASATRESGGGTGAQTLAGLVGGLSPAVATSGSAATLRGLLRGSSGETMQDNIAAFRGVGATPSAGQAAGNKRLQGAESLLAGGPTSAGVMNRFAEGQANRIGTGLQKQADSFYPNASAERAGRAVERGVDVASKKIAATRKALYWNVDRLISGKTTVPMNRTQQTLAALTTPTPGARATSGSLINPRIAQLANDLATDLKAGGGAGIPYDAVKNIRSRIGEELSDFALSADRPTAQYKRLYAALSQDMEDAARQRGPEVMQAVKRANGYFKASAERLEQLERVVDKNGGPEKVFQAVMSGTKDGGTTLRAVMQSLPKEGQRAVTGAVIKRMGMATPGHQGATGDSFSAQTFLTNWNNVSTEAKRALFDRHGPQFAASMDRVAKVAENIRNGSKVFANPSGTTNRSAAYGYVISLLGSLGTGHVGAFGGLAAGGVSANVMARAFTSPAFVNWLARSTTLPVGALPAQLQTVRALAEAQGDDFVVEVADALERGFYADGDRSQGTPRPGYRSPPQRAANVR